MLDGLYLFDTRKRLRLPIVSGISTCIHKERAHMLTAEVPAMCGAAVGEYLGMTCIDGRFRLFEIQTADLDDVQSSLYVTGIDAAVTELAGIMVEDVQWKAQTARQAAEKSLSGTAWRLGQVTAEGQTADFSDYFQSAWKIMGMVEERLDAWVIPYFEFENGQITGRKVDVLKKTYPFRGRLIESGLYADDVHIHQKGSPCPMVYGLGAADENGKPLTFADVAWSKAAGDPVDKPRGQLWVGVPEAVEQYPGKGQRIELTGCDDPKRLLEYAWKKAQQAAQPETEASARVTDLEMIAGQEHRMIRLHDQMLVRPRVGADVRAVVVEISRDYIRPDLTKVELGTEDKLPEDIVRKQIKEISEAGVRLGRGAGGAGAAAERNYQLIETMQFDITETQTDLSYVWIELDAVNTTLTMKAEKDELTHAVSRINSAEIRLDGAEANLLLKAESRTVDAQGERIKSAELEIDGLNSTIALKADRIELEGLVTAGQLKSEITALKTAFAANMSITNLDVGNLKFKGYDIGFNHVTVLTDASISVSRSKTLNVQLVDGRGASIRYVTGVSLDTQTADIYYMKYA